MKVQIQVLYNELGDKYLEQKEELVNITHNDEYIYIDYNGELLKIPKQLIK